MTKSPMTKSSMTKSSMTKSSMTNVTSLPPACCCRHLAWMIVLSLEPRCALPPHFAAHPSHWCRCGLKFPQKVARQFDGNVVFSRYLGYHFCRIRTLLFAMLKFWAAVSTERGVRSIEREPDRADHFRPRFGLTAHEGGKLARRGREGRLNTGIADLLAQVLIGHHRLDCGAELVDCGGRGASGRHDALPDAKIIAWINLADRRDLRRHGQTGRRHHGKDLQ